MKPQSFKSIAIEMIDRKIAKENAYLVTRALEELKEELMGVNEWIDVKEGLPENGQSILVYLKPMEEGVEGDIKDARFFSDTLGTRFRVGAGDFVHGMYVKHKEYIQRDTDDILYKLTHWMPLPSLPPSP